MSCLRGDREGVKDHHHQENDAEVEAGSLKAPFREKTKWNWGTVIWKSPAVKTEMNWERHPQRQANRQGKNTDEQGLQEERKRGYAPSVRGPEAYRCPVPFPP